MRKKLLLTVAVLSVLGIHSSAQALSFEDAKAIFDTPVSTTPDEPISDLESDENTPSNQAPGDASETLRGESEPNNSAESADPLESGVEYIGQIFGPEDQDWFRIDTTQNNEILTIQTAVANSLWLFTVRDRAGNILASSVNNDSDGVIPQNPDNPDLADQFKMSVTVEKAGTYYVIVSPAPDLFGLQGDNTFTDFSSQTYHMSVTVSDPTNPDNPVVDSNFNDLETEPNSGPAIADPLASGKVLFGQLLNGGDEDWFEIQSPGNEIVDINFCGPLTPCAGQVSRIVMVLKKEFIDTAVQSALESPALVYDPAKRDGPAGTIPPFIEYLGEQGLLGDALIGKIHPDFGQQNHLQIGIDQPGTYYFVVASKLARNANGSIDTHVKIGSTQNNCSVDNGDNVQSVETAIEIAIDQAGLAVDGIDKLIKELEDGSADESAARDAKSAAREAELAALNAKSAANAGDMVEAARKAKLAADKADTAIQRIDEVTDLVGNTTTTARDARQAALDAKRAALDAESVAKGAVTTTVTTGNVNFSPCEPETIVVTEEPFVVFADFNDDQYAISIRRTNLAPHTPGTDEFAAERARASFDSSTNIIHIPELEFNGAVFEAELIHRNEDERNIYELLQLRELDQ